MITIPGFKILEKLHEGKRSLVFRALRINDHKPVVLKTVSHEYPSPIEVARLNREFEITGGFHSEGIIQTLNIESVYNAPVIVLEDFGGDSLELSLSSQSLTLELFFSLALRLVYALDEIHSNQIIHRDINPSNIVWNQKEDIVKIIDFGISSELSRDIGQLKKSSLFEGTLYSISPEQTGRMNVIVDYRTDFYSLGVTFYWMLSGSYPFESMDMLEMIHAHIAKEPRPVHELNPDVPPALSGVILKMMSKNVEERYQSDSGLIHDLMACRDAIRKKQPLHNFIPGQRDFSVLFQIPGRLYGRSQEFGLMEDAFERVHKGAVELLLVSGPAGIGKSALCKQIAGPVREAGGRLISGKYDKLKKDMPYSALIEAFTGLVQQLLVEPEERLENLKARLKATLGPNGRVITDVIPDLEIIIGAQGALPALDPEEERNRFKLYFQYFVAGFCSENEPLVILLDDLQWADESGLKMLQSFLNDPEISHLLILGTNRTNKDEEKEFVDAAFREIDESRVRISRLYLSALKQDTIVEMLCDMFRCEPASVGELAEHLVLKTEANPLFLSEFLKSLYQEGVIEFKRGVGWEWNLDGVIARDVTANVVELMAKKIQTLSGDARELLKMGACFGHTFKIDLLSEILEQPTDKIQSALIDTLEQGFLFRLGEKISFSHDRVQEAAYSLITDEQRVFFHYRIGTKAREKAGEELSREELFFICNQFNAARSMFKTREEKQELSRLNFKAGALARSSSAYGPALNYLSLACELLPEDSWKSQYAYCLAVHQESAVVAYLCGEYEEMEKRSELVFQNATSVIDMIPVYESRIFAAMARQEYSDVIAIGHEVLLKLGEDVPENPGTFRIVLELAFLKMKLSINKLNKLSESPRITNPEKIAAMRILSSLCSFATIARPNMFPLLVFKLLHLSVRYGLSDKYSPFAVTAYAMIHCGMLGAIKTGIDYGEFVLRLMGKINKPESTLRIQLAIWYFIKPNYVHLKKTLEPIQEVYDLGCQMGDLEFLGFGSHGVVINSFWLGKELGALEKKLKDSLLILRKHNQKYTVNGTLVLGQMIENFVRSGDEPWRLNGTYLNDEKYIKHLRDAEDHVNVSYFHLYSAMLCFHFGQKEKGVHNLKNAPPSGIVMVATPFYPELLLYSSLLHIDTMSESGRKSRRQTLRILSDNQSKLKKRAETAPMNYLHKYQLIEAEIARIKGRILEARLLYERALKNADENGCIKDEALIQERFGNFWESQGNYAVAGLYMSRAVKAYTHWGAVALVHYLENTYPQYTPEIEPHMIDGRLSTESTDNASGRRLDLATVLKGSQAISGEIQLDRVLRKMMTIVMENAGAQRGMLLLRSELGLRIEAEAELESGKITVLHSIPYEESNQLAKSVIQYVKRARKDLVLQNATLDENFSSDEHIQEHKVKSLLCMPVLNQGRLQAILYLENNISTDVFTAERLTVLNMLSSQIAVSIDNARLYSSLEEKVLERTRQLESANHKLRDLDELKNNLFTNIAHEIRTPLTLMLSPLDDLISQEASHADSIRLPLLRIMNRNGRRLLKQVNDLLELAKMKSGKVSMRYRKTDLGPFIRELNTLFSGAAATKNIRMEYTGEGSFWAAIDPEKIEKVLLNILGNALKFTHEGEITTELKERDGFIQINIVDTGIGIPSGEEEVIFNRFHRLEKEGGGTQPGTGVGLALARELVGLHGGTIRAEPREKGAQFIINIPRGPLESMEFEYSGRVSDEALQELDESIYREEPESFPEEVAGLLALEGSGEATREITFSVLIVEDNPEMRDYLASLLSPRFKIYLAENGVQGLESALKDRPNLIISDVMMPEMDGVNMLSQIRKQEKLKGLPVIMLSAKSELAPRLEGLSAGADDYISKPFRPKELILKVHNLLQKDAFFELSKLKEREAVYADLHDYLGGSLTDLALMVEHLKRKLGRGESLVQQLDQNVQSAVRNYRQCFDKIGDLEQLREDFTEGLNLILLRRYSNAERDFTFRADEELNSVFADRRYDELKTVLYAVLMEAATNDLKYGEGQSLWDLKLLDGHFILEFSAPTRYRVDPGRQGRGRNNIHRRMQKMHGEAEGEIRDGQYFLRLKVALK